MSDLGLRFHEGTCYRVTGDLHSKPLIVFIHGVGLNQDMWLPWIPTLGRNYCVLTFDLYGHGQSENPEGPRSVRDFVDQLVSLLKHLKVEKLVLAGFSLGAIISQAFASLFSDRLIALILLHSVYQRTEEQCQGVRERYEITRDQGPMATVELAIKRWFTEPYQRENPGEMDDLRRIFSQHSGDGYLKAYYLFGHAEAEMASYPINHVRCPALVITGGDDVGSTPLMSAALAREFSDAELTINPTHRHMGPAEFAKQMSQQVLSFLIKKQYAKKRTN